MSLKNTVDTVSKLYETYEQSMFFDAKAILNDDYLAEDAVHEAFLRLVRSGKDFDDIVSNKTKSYVKKVLRSAAIDIYRQNKRNRENCETLDENESIPCAQQEYNHILPLIDGLPDKYRTVVRCIAIHGLSVRESAAVLRISEVCVRKRYERAKKLLRDKLNSETYPTYTKERKISDER